jgi:hypothetical protein
MDKRSSSSNESPITGEGDLKSIPFSAVVVVVAMFLVCYKKRTEKEDNNFKE